MENKPDSLMATCEPAQKTKMNAEDAAARTIIDTNGLCHPSKGTISRIGENPEEQKKRLNRMEEAVKALLDSIGEDSTREGLLATPSRYAKALLFLTKGYETKITTLINNAIFNENHNEMVIVKDIEIHSVCEHHLIPFTGKVNLSPLLPFYFRTAKLTQKRIGAHRLPPLKFRNRPL
jgi:GTP cyclohydrolase IA